MQYQETGARRESLAEENAKLRQQIEASQRECGRLQEELERANANARNARQELQDFVYAASHDLKEPLRSISSYTQLLQRPGADPEQMAAYSRFVLEGVNAATKLLEQLLRLSRAGSNLRRTHMSLNIPLQSALYRLQAVIRDLGAEVSCGTLPQFSIDEAQFALLLEHLVDNSLKYRSQAAPRVQILGEETDDGLLLSIQDNGVGIPPEFREQVFAPFKRLHGREIPGAGLGLAISRKIVEAHEGKIWVDSNGSGGVTVKISLPY